MVPRSWMAPPRSPPADVRRAALFANWLVSCSCGCWMNFSRSPRQQSCNGVFPRSPQAYTKLSSAARSTHGSLFLLQSSHLSCCASNERRLASYLRTAEAKHFTHWLAGSTVFLPFLNLTLATPQYKRKFKKKFQT